jgi:hypothetical protein
MRPSHVDVDVSDEDEDVINIELQATDSSGSSSYDTGSSDRDPQNSVTTFWTCASLGANRQPSKSENYSDVVDGDASKEVIISQRSSKTARFLVSSS